MPTLTTATKTNKPVVYERRQCNVDASLVRIIKARKSISHQDLVSEVLTQTQFFQPTPKFIKSRIESLIEREYLERDSDKPDLYTFVA